MDFPPRCFAWALMSNHFHFLLRTGLVPTTDDGEARKDFAYFLSFFQSTPLCSLM
jgi:hypothetical protein